MRFPHLSNVSGVEHVYNTMATKDKKKNRKRDNGFKAKLLAGNLRKNDTDLESNRFRSLTDSKPDVMNMSTENDVQENEDSSGQNTEAAAINPLR